MDGLIAHISLTKPLPPEIENVLDGYRKEKESLKSQVFEEKLSLSRSRSCPTRSVGWRSSSFASKLHLMRRGPSSRSCRLRWRRARLPWPSRAFGWWRCKLSGPSYVRLFQRLLVGLSVLMCLVLECMRIQRSLNEVGGVVAELREAEAEAQRAKQ
eukprot:4273900-Pyramimonas_sp.AAC.1